eukprot:1263508-Pyramimonas_sp.AAC.1
MSPHEAPRGDPRGGQMHSEKCEKWEAKTAPDIISYRAGSRAREKGAEGTGKRRDERPSADA